MIPGEIYWLALPGPGESPGIPHPHVVVQVDGPGRLVQVCALTTNRKRASLPGSVLLEPGEGGLPRRSVVEVSRLSVIEITRLGEYIGALAPARLAQVQSGIRFVQRLANSRPPPP